jgi:hypothetical protein
MSRHHSNESGNGAAHSGISPPPDVSLASAHAEAARQHAAAADAHALAAELHYEVFVPDEESGLVSKQDAACASSDALIQTETSAEASELAGVDVVIMRDALRMANEASRLAEGGEEPRKAHAQAAKHHAALAEKHAASVQALAPRSQEAQEAAFDAEAAFTRASNAEDAEQAA